MSIISTPAPAKANLSLEVVSRREDGFHEIDTLMVPLHGLHDTLTFTPSGAFSFSCDDQDVPVDDRNLVVKAVRLFEEACNVTVTHQILLIKRIPHGAGLGGGSSDAAVTLRTLNNLYGKPLKRAELLSLCATLGSDVPFFLNPAPYRCRGRGEVLEPVTPANPFALCLLKPDFGVSTPDAYAHWADSAELPSIPYNAQSGPYGAMVNHLERPVFQKYPFLAECKRWLLAQPEVKVAQMSGSGSTMLALLHDLTEADALIKRARADLDPNFFSWFGMV